MVTRIPFFLKFLWPRAWEITTHVHELLSQANRSDWFLLSDFYDFELWLLGILAGSGGDTRQMLRQSHVGSPGSLMLEVRGLARVSLNLGSVCLYLWGAGFQVSVTIPRGWRGGDEPRASSMQGMEGMHATTVDPLGFSSFVFLHWLLKMTCKLWMNCFNSGK